MGTRSLTCVLDDGSYTEILTMYRQFDGHPESHGQDLVDFLTPFTIVNGLGSHQGQVANGMGCLAAQLVAHFKEGPGCTYIERTGIRDCGEEYVYIISIRDEQLHLRVLAGAMTAFGMPGTKEENMPSLFDGPVSRWVLSGVKAAEKLAREKGIPNDFLETQTQEA